MKLQPRIREMTGAERRLLRCSIRRSESGRGGSWKVTLISTLLLWGVTMSFFDDPWPVITLFWILMGGAIHLMAFRDSNRAAAAMASSFRSALRRGEVESYDVSAVAFAEFEEVEDEGACYAFEVDDERLVFFSGQEFYPGARFPCLDFSVVYPLDEHGASVDMWLVKRGPRVSADRVIPATVKERLASRVPESLEVIAGTLAELEQVLSATD